MSVKVGMVSLGCSKNQVDAERLLAQLRGVDKLSPAVQQQRNAEIAVVRADVRSARTLRHEPGAAFQPRGDRQPHRPHAARQRAASCCQ